MKKQEHIAIARALNRARTGGDGQFRKVVEYVADALETDGAAFDRLVFEQVAFGDRHATWGSHEKEKR